MAFEFIREEITEARYIRSASDTVGRDMNDVGESFFEQLIMLQQMRFENPTFAKKYAKDTLKFMNFTSVKPGGTDLHNLAAIITNPNKYQGVTSGGKVGIDELGFKRYLRDIAAGRSNTAMDRSFLMRQQKNLGIDSSFLKAARRVSGDYGRSNAGERTALSARMVNSQRVDGKFRSDISKNYMSTIKKNKVLSSHMQKCFESLRDHPHVSDVRQKGMVLAIELVKDKKRKISYNWKERRGIRAYLHGLKNNVLMRPLGNVLYFMPPYVITKKEISFVSEIMKEGVNEATKKNT